MSRLLQPTTLIAALSLGAGTWGGAPPIRPAAASDPKAPAVTRPEAPVPTASSVRIEPEALALLAQMAAAYRALSTYSGAMTFSGTGLPDDAPRLRAHITLQRPDRIAVTADDEHSTIQVVADGAHLHVHAPRRLPGYYLKLPALPGGQAIGRALGHAGAAALSPTPYLFTGVDLAARLGPALAALSVGKPDVVDGIAVETVVATVSGKAGPRTLTFSIGKDDHLLRRATMTLEADGKQATLTETHTDIRVDPNLPATAFAFAPPPNSEAVTTLEAWAAAATFAPAPTLAAAGLVVLPDNGMKDRTTFEHPGQHGHHDFGQVSLLDRQQIEHTFTLKNRSDKPLTIERLRATCGCLSTLVQPGQAPPVPAASEGAVRSDTGLATLAPGEQVSVRVTVNLAGLPPGPVHKPVSVFVRGNAQPAAVLEVRGTLLPSVTFAPAILDLGRVQAGTARSLTLTVTLDPRMVRSGASSSTTLLPSLISSNPAIRVGSARVLVAPELVSDKTATSKKSSGTTTNADGGMRNTEPVQVAYTVTLAPDAPLGPIMGSLSFAPAAGAAAATALRNTPVPMLGQVTGDVAAQPQTLAFGVVSAGQKVNRQVVLSARDAAALDKLALHGDDAWLTARLTDAARPDATSPVTRTLEVTLGETAPAGALQTRLQITLSNGQCLVIPINAYVQQPQRTVERAERAEETQQGKQQ